MLYYDYNFDISENSIVFDAELKLRGQENNNKWGNLPDNWKENDVFMLKVVNNKVVLYRRPD